MQIWGQSNCSDPKYLNRVFSGEIHDRTFGIINYDVESYLCFLPGCQRTKKIFDKFRFRCGADCEKITFRRFDVVYFTFIYGNISVNSPLNQFHIQQAPPGQGGDGIGTAGEGRQLVIQVRGGRRAQPQPVSVITVRCYTHGSSNRNASFQRAIQKG